MLRKKHAGRIYKSAQRGPLPTVRPRQQADLIELRPRLLGDHRVPNHHLGDLLLEYDERKRNLSGVFVRDSNDSRVCYVSVAQQVAFELGGCNLVPLHFDEFLRAANT